MVRLLQMRMIPALLAVFAIFLAGCGHKKHARKAPAPPAPTAMPRVGDTEVGVASWYGHPYHGRPAANGEIYDMEKLTAAHRTLPFNTWVRVENLSNRKSVEVRIIDRGPFVDGRIVDLSHAAARAVDLIGPGVAQVRMEVIRIPEVPVPSLFAVQVGAFRERRNAERMRSEMESKYGAAWLVERPGKPVVWRVLVGSEKTEGGASGLADRIRREGNEKSAAFVVRVDTV